MNATPPMNDNEQVYDVRITTPALVTNEAVLKYRGKAQLVVNADDITFSRQTTTGGEPMIKLKWNAIRELRDELATKKRFRANFGGQGSDIVLIVKIVKGDTGYLLSLLKQLPESANSMRCPACGGAVRGGVCSQCGTNPSALHRKDGLVMLIFGILSSAVGMIIMEAVHATEVGFLFGIVWIGAIIALLGLVKLLFGVRGE